MEVEVIKSPNDHRLYKRIVLVNGLRCLLIHDPEINTKATQNEEGSEDDGDEDEEMTEASAAADDNVKSKNAAVALSVGVGSFMDPQYLQGLAHYLEHMLFMGSEKFPTENEYDDYIHKNGGSTNAWTDLDNTSYLLDVKGSALYGALDRFAQFFIGPLCLEDSLDREVMAVDSEFSLSLQDDNHRHARLMEHTAKSGHFFNKFTIGNKDSLKHEPAAKNISVREKLFEFYKQHYSAERMCLVVLGGEDLSDLESWVTELFSPIPSGLGSIPSFHGHDFPFEGQMFYLLPSVKQVDEVVISFQFPSLQNEYRKKSDHYISHLIGHEGAGSLLSELKSRGWATEICAGVADSAFNANSCVYLFQVSITLTEKGLKEEPGFGLAPVALLFKYLDFLRSTEPMQWIYDEMKSTNETKFKFLEEEDPCHYVSKVSTEMLTKKPGDELVADYLYEGLDANRVTELLSLMRPGVEGIRIDVQTKDYEALSLEAKKNKTHFKSAEDCLEPRYNINFIKCEFSQHFMDYVASFPPSPNLALPQPNPYIPKSFKVLCQEQNTDSSKDRSSVIPDLLTDLPGLRVWHKVDALHKTPKTVVCFLLVGPSCPDSGKSLWRKTAKDAAAHQLLVDILEDILTEECYMAQLANLDLDISTGHYGIDVKLNGFSEKIPLLAQMVFKTLASLKVEEKIFQNMHEALVRKCKNVNTKVRQQVEYVRLHTLIPTQWHVNEILEALYKLTPQDIEEHLSLILKEMHIEALIYGNLDVSEATELCKQVREAMGRNGLESSDRKMVRCLQLKHSNHLLRVDAKNPKDTNSGVQAYIQCGPNNIDARCKLDLIQQIVEEPCFDQLRTHEQLGYLVACRVRLTFEILGFSVLVISERFPPNHVNLRIDAFVDHCEKSLKILSSDEFEHHKATLVDIKLQKDKNIGETTSILWSHILSRQYEFDSKEKEVSIIRKLTKQDIMDYYAEFISPHSNNRKQLLVNVLSPSHEEKNVALESSNAAKELIDVSNFRATMGLFPEPKEILF